MRPKAIVLLVIVLLLIIIMAQNHGSKHSCYLIKPAILDCLHATDFLIAFFLLGGFVLGYLTSILSKKR